MLFVIINCETIKQGHELQSVTTAFLQTLIEGTNELKVILITEEKGSSNFDWHCNIEITPVSKETKIKLFKNKMESENKMALFKAIKNLEDHSIFDKVGI
jgi:hypothetical protein